jgi:hypothetical protein
MSRRKIKAGSVAVMETVFVEDSSSATGAGLSVAYNSSGMTCEWRREGDASWTAVTLVGGTVGTFTSGSLVASGSLTGRMQFCPPNAALAAGAKSVEVWLYGVTNMLPVVLTYELDTIDYQAAGGKVPATLAAADASGNLPTADSSGTTTLLARLTATRAGLLDNLDAPLSSILTAVNNLNNLSALENLYGPQVLEIPDAGTTQYPFTVTVRDTEGHLVALDAAPTVTAANAAGTSRSANLSAVTNPSTGVYLFSYGTTSTAAEEGLRVVATGAVGGSARRAETVVAVANYDSITTLAAIRAKTDNLPANPAAVSDVPTAAVVAAAVRDVSNATPAAGSLGEGIFNTLNTAGGLSDTLNDFRTYAEAMLDVAVGTRLAATEYVAPDNAGIAAAAASAATAATNAADASTQAVAANAAASAVAAILGGITSLGNWLRAIVRKDPANVTALAQINNGGGSYDPTTDSGQAVRDRGDAAWVTGTGPDLSGLLTTAAFNASNAQTAGTRLLTMLQVAAGSTYQYTTGALVHAPTGSGGSATITDADVAAIAAASAASTAAALAGSTPVLQGVVDVASASRLRLVAGDAYDEAPRVPTWTITGYAGVGLAGAGTLRLSSYAAYYEGAPEPPAELEAAAAVAVAGSTVTVTAPLTAAQTAALTTPPGTQQLTHVYQLLGTTADGDPVTLLIGKATVARRVVPSP